MVPGLNAPVARGLRSKATPVETIRKSVRNAGEEAARVMDRAVRLIADKNASTSKPSPSTKKTQKGTNLDPIFAILQDLPDTNLLSIPADSCVVFPASLGSLAEALSLIRANELAQAALASSRVRVKRELNERKEKENVELSTQCPERGPSRPDTVEPGETQVVAETREARCRGYRTRVPAWKINMAHQREAQLADSKSE